MQTKKKTIPEVNKPVQYGDWHGSGSLKLGRKRMLSVLFVSVLYLILSLLMSFDSLPLRIITAVIWVAAAFVYLYYNGMGVGQSEAAYAEIMFQRLQEGKALSDEDMQRCYHPLKGFFASMIGALPFVLIALVFAVLAKPTSYALGVLPNWMTAFTRQSGIGDALAFYQNREGITFLAILRVVVRSMTMPFINVAVKLGADATLWAERLSPLWVLIAPLGYGFGYRQGLKIRAKINTGIVIGDQRKKRRERKERRARSRSNAPERLI